MTFLPFGEFKPDSSALNSGGSPMALNVIPGSTGDYLPFPSLVAFSAGLPGRCRGVQCVRLSDGSSTIYVGDATAIWQSAGQQWTPRIGNLVLTSDEQWSFTQWRNYVIAASYENPVQWSVINSSVFNVMMASLRAPRARHVALVNRDFVVLGNTTDFVDGDRPTRVWWSARANPQDFNPDTVTGAGFEDLDAEDGAVQAIIGAEYGTVIMQKSIWRMTYEGGDVQFRFDKVVRNKGTISPGSVISFGRTIYFWDEDGPYAFDGAQATPIGDGKIAATAIGQLNQESRRWISAAIIPRQTIVMWAIPTNGQLSEKLYIYNWKTGRWSNAEVTVEMLFSTYTSSSLIDEPSMTGLNIDSPPQSLWPIDGEQFMGGLPVLGAFATDHSMKFFNGAPMPASIETSEMSPFGDRRAAVRSVRPVIDGAPDIYIRMAYRDSLASTPVYTQSSSVNLSGSSNVFAQGRYMRVNVYIPNGFTHAIGMETDFLREGVR